MTMSEQQETQRAFWRQVILFHPALQTWNRKSKDAEAFDTRAKSHDQETDAKTVLSR